MKLRNSEVLWRGKSVKGVALRMVMSGMVRKGKNKKTGPMPAASVYVDNGRSPLENQQSGDDVAICNGCPLRPSVASTCKKCGTEHGIFPRTRKCEKCGTEMVRCYVATMKGERSKEAASRDQEPISLEQAEARLAGKRVRWASYGNISNLPEEEVRPLLEATHPSSCMYEEEWEAAHAQWLREFAMASVGTSIARAERARELGFRWYRVLDGDDRKAALEGRYEDVKLLPDEVLCPFYTHGRQCIDCGLCNGVGPDGKRSRVKSIASPAI